MKEFCLCSFVIIAAFCILALSCEKPMVNGVPVSSIGVIWNRANSSVVPTNFILPVHRTTGTDYPAPADAPPAQAAAPCAAYLAMADDYSMYKYPCSGCHCKAGQVSLAYCRDSLGVLHSYTSSDAAASMIHRAGSGTMELN
jgi:hypothetical protein